MVSRRRFLALASTGAVFASGCSSLTQSDRSTPVNTSDGRDSGPTPTDADPRTSSAGSPTPTPGARVLDIRDFGAKVNGKTDDTDAIQAAIAAADTDDTVFFPPGETIVSATGREHSAAIHLDGDSVPKGLTLAGAGRESVVKLSRNQPRYHETLFLQVNSGFEGLTIQHLRLDGNKQRQGFEPGSGGHGIKSDDANSTDVPVDVHLSNLWVENFNMSGIKIRHGGFMIDRCTVRGCVKHGLAPDSSQDVQKYDPPIRITNCYCVENGLGGNPVTYGIDCSGGKIVVEDTVCEGNAQGTKTTSDGVDITYRRVRLEDNEIFGYIRPGDGADGRVAVTFEDVVSRGNGQAGFRLGSDTDYAVPTDLVATSNGKSNLSMTSDARLDAKRVWSNRSKNGFGIRCESAAGGHIGSYHAFHNARDAAKLEGNLKIESRDRQDKTDIDGVPTADEVGASGTVGEFST